MKNKSILFRGLVNSITEFDYNHYGTGDYTAVQQINFFGWVVKIANTYPRAREENSVRSTCQVTVWKGKNAPGKILFLGNTNDLIVERQGDYITIIEIKRTKKRKVG